MGQGGVKGPVGASRLKLSEKEKGPQCRIFIFLTPLTTYQQKSQEATSHFVVLYESLSKQHISLHRGIRHQDVFYEI